MKRFFLLVFSIIISNLIIAQTSIYDIQYTTTAGDGTYPSLLNGNSVTTGGIVTAINYLGGRYFISSSQGGAWNGIFIYDNNYSPAIGDSILITGSVYEYQGFTEITSLTSYQVISSSNPLPSAAQISTIEVTDEAYEGVFVEVDNCDVTSTFDSYGNFWVDDGSGSCEVRPGIYNFMNESFPLVDNYSLSYVKGVIGINYGSISIQPRFAEDIQSADNAFVLATEDKIVENTNAFAYPVKIAIHNRMKNITSFSLNMQYNQSNFQYNGFDETGTLTESGTISDVSTAGNIVLNFSGDFSFEGSDTLIMLDFNAIVSGNADLSFNTSAINGSNVTYYSEGNLEYSSTECDKPIGDTLTVVQRPLLNIPSIVIPQQQMDIECFAPETTTDWNVELFYDDISVAVQVDQATYDSGLDKWTLTTTIPNVDLYELYDMRVTASESLVDTVRNAVKVIDQFKDDYYFIHITDTHLPGHTFYGESGYETDESELDDLYEVIKDINLLNPEFVLLTGDLINEGELEDFECLRNHTLAVELLEKFEVPVYIVPGNHDLGGWDATPPPQGTSRREWWRFFGWRQREIPPTQTEYLTHDYSFDYGDVHFTGLEAYDNYDSYMYDVYGDYSFISSQLTWLNNDLAAAGDKTKVLFYHYDFKGEMDLSALGVDMALWGHTHTDAEDATHPYNISTASVCDENRTFRVIRVNNGSLQAESSVHTHSSGDMLTLTYNTVNDGSLDVVSATIQNNYDLSFNHGLVKFVMPSSEFGYDITNGRLMQVMDNGSTVVCYVEVTIPASDEITVTIQKKTESNIISLYEIQYTDEAGDGTYPSALNNQTVTTGGIVTAINYLGGRFFISSSQGGAWNGILVYDENYTPAIGDSILISGKVLEYNGYTELTDLSSLQVVSVGNSLPPATVISTNEVENEDYEGVLVEVNSCSVSSTLDEYGNFAVDDGAGSCEIKTGIYSLINDGFTLVNGYNFESIKGVIAYYYGVVSIQPRSLSDFKAADDGFIVITEDQIADNSSQISYPVKVSVVQSDKDITGYILQVQYNDEVFQYDGFDRTNTISESGSITDDSSDGNIELNFVGSTNFEKTDTLIRLNFTPFSIGTANLQFNGSSFNGYDLLYSVIGNLQSTYENTTGIVGVESHSNFKVYPNPFKNAAKFSYELKQKSKVDVSVYDLSGRKIKQLISRVEIPGSYTVIWDATDDNGIRVEDGIYLCVFKVNDETANTRQILFMK